MLKIRSILAIRRSKKCNRTRKQKAAEGPPSQIQWVNWLGMTEKYLRVNNLQDR
jgi:hypothetical protein